jgi:hypothetical protein
MLKIINLFITIMHFQPVHMLTAYVLIMNVLMIKKLSDLNLIQK